MREQKLHQTEILELAHVLVRDVKDQIIFWNTGAEQLYGWTKEEAVGQISHALLQTQFPEPLPSIKTQLWKGGQWKGELMHRPVMDTRSRSLATGCYTRTHWASRWRSLKSITTLPN